MYPRNSEPSRGSAHRPHTSPDGGCADRAPHNAQDAQGMHSAPIVQIVHQGFVSNVNQSDITDWARTFRKRFGQQVKLFSPAPWWTDTTIDGPIVMTRQQIAADKAAYAKRWAL